MKTSRFSNANFSLPFRKIKIRVVLIQGLSVIKVQRYPKSLEWAEALQKGPLSVGCAQTTKCCVGRTLYDQKIQRQLNWVKVFFSFSGFWYHSGLSETTVFARIEKNGPSKHFATLVWQTLGLKWAGFFCYSLGFLLLYHSNLDHGGNRVFVWCYLFNWVM